MTEKKTPESGESTTNSSPPSISILDPSRAYALIESHYPFDQFYADAFPKYAVGTPDAPGPRCPECNGPFELSSSQGICHGKCKEQADSSSDPLRKSSHIKKVWHLLALKNTELGERGWNTNRAVSHLGAQMGFAIAWGKLTAEQREHQRALINSALLMLSLGIAVFPCNWIVETPERKCSCLLKYKTKKTACESPGKHPDDTLVPNGCLNATLDRAQVLEWWSIHPLANVAIATGAISNIWALDVDGDEGCENLQTLEAQHVDQPIPRTPMALTGGGGYHYLFRLPTNGHVIRNGVNLLPKLDVRGEGGYILIEPSNHVSGNTYMWDSGLHPEDTPIADAPDWLVKLALKETDAPRNLSPSQRTPVSTLPSRPFAEILAGVPEGERDNAIFQYACSRLALKIGVSEIRTLVYEAAANCSPPFPQDEAERKIESAIRIHLSNNPGWTDPTYTLPEDSDSPSDATSDPDSPSPSPTRRAPVPQPETADEMVGIITSMITELRSARSIDLDATTLFTPARVAAAERARDTEPLLFANLNTALKRHSLVKPLQAELNRRQIGIASPTPSGDKPVVTVKARLDHLGITPPPTLSIPADRLIVPIPYVLDEQGVGMVGYAASGALERSAIAPSLVIPTAVSKDIVSALESIYVAFLTPSGWDHAVIEREYVVDASHIVKHLASKGGPASSHNSKILTRFLFDFLSCNEATIPVHRDNTQIGWLPKKNKYVWGKMSETKT